MDISYLQRFFADVLRVPDATWEDIVSDIEGEKDKDAKEVDVNRITNLYGCLAGLSLSNDAKRAMRYRARTLYPV